MAAKHINKNPAAILECFKLTGVTKTGRTLGRGSYAQVVELSYRELTCAGKELYPTPLPTDDLSLDRTMAVLERVKKECDMLSSVKHPNIVQFMGVYFDERSPLPLLVMEYVPFTLSQHLEEHKPYPPEVSYGILADVARALCYLHGGDPVIIHRDLSANNVLLTHDMSAKVSDLGTAKRLSEKLTQHLTRCPGTLVYMPPEAYNKGGTTATYDETLDCFSYGVLMLHIFSGEWPEAKDFSSGSSASEMDRRQKFVDKMGSGHPLMGLVEKCLGVAKVRPNAKKILEKINEVRQQCCRSKSDKLSLLVLTNTGKLDKMEETIARLKSKQQNMEDQHSVEMIESANKIEELHNNIEELNACVELLKRDRKVDEERIEKKEEEVSFLRSEMEEEIDAIKKQAEEERKECREKRDKEINRMKLEVNEYKEILCEKEQRLDEIIRKSVERQRRYKSEIVSDAKLHPLHHSANQFKWRHLSELPIGMTAPQCICIDSTIYVGGGQTVNTDKELRKTIFEYDTTGNDGNSWKTRFPKCPTMHFGLGELDGKVVVVGGQRESLEDKEQMVITAEVFVLDGTQMWSTDIIPSMNIARMRTCVVSYKGCLAACGGLVDKGSRACSPTVELYQSKTKMWYVVESLPVARAALRATVINSTVYLMGGFYPDMTGVSEKDCVSIRLEDLFRLDSTAQISWNSHITNTPYHSSAPGNICGSLLTIGGAFLNQQTQISTDEICAYCPAVDKWHHVGNLPVSLSSATSMTLASGEMVVLGGRLVGDSRNGNVYIGSLES